MPSQKPRLMTYTTQDLIDKFQFISNYESRSASKELEYIVKQYIENFEVQHGEIIPDENGTLTTAKPKAVHKDKSSSSKTG
jgi:hypothetical protein